MCAFERKIEGEKERERESHLGKSLFSSFTEIDGLKGPLEIDLNHPISLAINEVRSW